MEICVYHIKHISCMIKPKLKILSDLPSSPVSTPAHIPTSIPAPSKKDENQFKSLEKLSELLKEIVENNVFFMFDELLQKISLDYQDKGIFYMELQNKYMLYFKDKMRNSNLYSRYLSLNVNSGEFNSLIDNGTTVQNTDDTHKSSLNPQISEDKCMARTSTNIQCSRHRSKDSEFCGSHTHNQPYGRIDKPLTTDTQPKKRGRPPVNKDEINKNIVVEKHITDIDEIDAIIEVIDGINYIVDNNAGNIYKMPPDYSSSNELTLDQLKLVGKKLPNSTIQWYSEIDMQFT